MHSTFGRFEVYIGGGGKHFKHLSIPEYFVFFLRPSLPPLTSIPNPPIKILRIFKYNFKICDVGQWYHSDVRRTPAMQLGNTARLHHSVWLL